MEVATNEEATVAVPYIPICSLLWKSGREGGGEKEGGREGLVPVNGKCMLQTLTVNLIQKFS